VARRLTGPLSAEAAAETERIVAWLRLPLIALLALGEGLPHPNPQTVAFVITLALFSGWSAAVLAWVYVRTPGPRFAVVTTAADIAAITVLAVLSGGAFSHARLGYFVVPVTVAFRFRPAMTAAATLAVTTAYVAQAAAHPATGEDEKARFIATQAGFLLWVGVACVLLSYLLARRTDAVFELAQSRSRLLTDALAAETRERRVLAEALHDSALQNLLGARHEIEEAAEASPHPALVRADDALSATVEQLRNAVFELHPYVLEETGLEASVRSAARQAASRGGFQLALHLAYDERDANDQLLFSAARELLANVVEHADASRVEVVLAADGDDVRLLVADDGVGFSPEELADRLAAGHIGLASQRVRIEAAGGSLEVGSAPRAGTRVEVRVPHGRR
jgi:two-component system, NarL family, sensor kinase